MAAENQKYKSLLELATILGRQKNYQETLRFVAQQDTDIFAAESATVTMLNPRTRQTMATIFRENEKPANDIQHKIFELWILDFTAKKQRLRCLWNNA